LYKFSSTFCSENVPIVRMVYSYVKLGMKNIFIANVTKEMRTFIQIENFIFVIYCIAKKKHQ